MICCPSCNSGSIDMGNNRRKCRLCGLSFLKQHGILRNPLQHREARIQYLQKPKTPKYHGTKAGKIVHGRGAKWGAGLV